MATTRPEYESVTNPDKTVGEWSYGGPTSGPTTKPIFIREGDALLGFTVPIMEEVSGIDYTVPEIIVEGVQMLTVDSTVYKADSTLITADQTEI
jgi:hypothetical protein